MRDALAEIAEETGSSMYELTRQAVADFIYRHQVGRRAAQVSTLGDHEPVGVIPS